MKILFLHGAIASKSQFDQLIPLLKKYECHSINFSGHGGKWVPSSGFNLETFCNDILEYLDEQKIDRINLFGYSMGGYVALLFASKHPDRVDKIFTLNVKYKWDIESTLKETSFLNPESIMEKVPFFASNLILQHGLHMWQNLLHQTSQMMMDISKNKQLEKEDYAKITQPCLLAIGEKDNTSSLDETREVYQHLPHANFLVIPKAPHPFEKISLPRLQFEIEQFFVP